MFVGMALVLLAPGWSRCAERSVRAGDQAAIHFTCRLATGEIAASSYGSVAADPALRKSSVFTARKGDEPVPLKAGVSYEPAPPYQERSMEEEILARLSA
jgi:hypothetical protein